MSASWMSDLRVAVSFLTRLPVAPADRLPPNGLADAMRAFPLAGAMVGAVAGTVHWAAYGLLGPVIAALLAVAAAVWLTGGLHEDGLADTADGFGARGGRLERLDVMRDSRIGSFGVLALMISLALRTAALAALAPGLPAVAALVAAGALSRAVMPLTMRLLPPARADGLGFGAGKPKPGTVLAAVLLAVAITLAGLGVTGGALAVLAAFVAMMWVHRAAEGRLGGFTGDILGALQQAVEAAVLLAAVALR